MGREATRPFDAGAAAAAQFAGGALVGENVVEDLAESFEQARVTMEAAAREGVMEGEVAGGGGDGARVAAAEDRETRKFISGVVEQGLHAAVEGGNVAAGAG